MQVSLKLQPTVASRLALTPNLRGQIALVALDAQALEDHVETLFSARADVALTTSPAQTLARLFPPRAAPYYSRLTGLGSMPELSAASAPDLIEHIYRQIGLTLRDPVDQKIARYVTQYVAPTGWLELDPLLHADEIAGAEAHRLPRLLKTLQDFEPAGIFARTLKECLWLQARDLDLIDPIMEAILDDLSRVAKGELAYIAQQSGGDVEEVAKRVKALRSFDPKPGLQFSHDAPPPPEPDLMLQRLGQGWRVSLNPRTSCEITAVDVSGRADVAAMESIFSFRATSLLKVGQWFAEHQSKFLTDGIAALRPFTRRDLAAELGYHETTIGRALRHRLMQTPRGMFSIDQLFGALRPKPSVDLVWSFDDAEKAVHDGVSPHALRARLRELIAAERPGARLSDADLTRLLAVEGINLSRRTVAKYRSEMSILSAPERGA